MLSLYAAPNKKMNRHGYSGSHDKKTPTSPVPLGYVGRTNTSGESGRVVRIKTDKWEKYQPRSRGPAAYLHSTRRSTLTRAGSLLTAFLLLLLYFFPALRPTYLLDLLFPPGEEFNIETVRYYDLSNVGGTSRGWEREERILLCAPLRDAAPHLPMFFSHLKNLTYPHNLIDLAFLVGDSKDNTADLLSDLLTELQEPTNNPKDWFGEISVIEKDFGQVVNQDVESRHGFAAQAGRRKSMAQARNWLLSAALRPTHSWVYWRDVDVETAPFTILEDLMRHNKDIIVPNVWRPLPEWLGGEQPYDLNSWQESETALALAETLDEDAVIVEGYAEYATWRPHLAYLRDPYGDPDMEMEIDGVGGVSILAKARVFRSGVHFPAFSFERHAETEGFGKMAKRMQFSVVGLPHYTIWHLYEPSFEDIRHMEEMEQEKKRREEEERERKERLEMIERQFDTDAKRQFEKDKEAMRESRKVEEEEAKAREKEEGKRVEVTKEEVLAGVAGSEASFAQDAEGKTHLNDPLDEIKHVGGDDSRDSRDRADRSDRSDSRDNRDTAGSSSSPSLEKQKEKERTEAAEAAAAQLLDNAAKQADMFERMREKAQGARWEAGAAAEQPEDSSAWEDDDDARRPLPQDEGEEDGWRDPRKIHAEGGG